MPRYKLTRRKGSPKPQKLTKPRRKAPEAISAVDWDVLWDRLASGHSVADVCADNEGWPTAQKLHLAIAGSPELSEAYRLARRAGVMASSEELLLIADDSRNDYMDRIGKNGREFKSVDAEAVQRSRLRIDARLKLLEAYAPETFGKKIDLSNKDGTLASTWANALGVVNAEKQNATKH